MKPVQPLLVEVASGGVDDVGNRGGTPLYYRPTAVAEQSWRVNPVVPGQQRNHSTVRITSDGVTVAKSACQAVFTASVPEMSPER